MAEIAKRLTFEDTGGLAAGSASSRALAELRKAHDEVTVAIKQRSTQLMELAKQAADGGGENDLKRLQRQFQTLKATYISCDVKERFMQELELEQLDVKQQEQLYREREQQLESHADALRTLKDQNGQAKERIMAKIERLCGLYSRMHAASSMTQGQLDGIQCTVEQHEAQRPPPESPLEPGPCEEDAQRLLDSEMRQAKQLEAFIASTEAGIADLEGNMSAHEHELQAMKAEVERLHVLHADRAKAADADASTRQSLDWCEEAAAAVSKVNGISITSVTKDALVLLLRCVVPLSKLQAPQPGVPQRTMDHELTLLFKPGTAYLHEARLAPSVVPVDDIVQCSKEGRPTLQLVVREVRARVLAYWQRQLLIEAAAERYSLTGMGPNEPAIRAQLPGCLEADVAVPWQWPAEGAGGLVLLRVAGAQRLDEAAVMRAVNGDGVLGAGDLLALLDGVVAAAAAAQQ